MSRIGITNRNICGIRNSEMARQDPVTYTPFPKKKLLLPLPLSLPSSHQMSVQSKIASPISVSSGSSSPANKFSNSGAISVSSSPTAARTSKPIESASSRVTTLPRSSYDDLRVELRKTLLDLQKTNQRCLVLERENANLKGQVNGILYVFSL